MMASTYPGSVLLEQDAVGHCALSASLGDCVRGHVERYFNQGTLPIRDTVFLVAVNHSRNAAGEQSGLLCNIFLTYDGALGFLWKGISMGEIDGCERCLLHAMLDISNPCTARH